ncbi:hypothetical protein [Nonomuraea endophytica]|uniref:hypothetical protein n=1 Tax=Nonomuraea endophytica TaxID=714136 RepID=UPI0037CBE648
MRPLDDSPELVSVVGHTLLVPHPVERMGRQSLKPKVSVISNIDFAQGFRLVGLEQRHNRCSPVGLIIFLEV